MVLLSGCNPAGPLLINISTEKISRKLDKAIPTLMQDYDVVGLSVVVIRNGKISNSKSFGYRDIESKKKVDEYTVYRAASLGKPIFAYIVVMLAQQGKIDLDTPLYSYLREEIVAGDPRSKIISARMVL
ncbi:MAG: serine hydrolase domain-containing protein [Thiohalomonadales bacterium]